MLDFADLDMVRHACLRRRSAALEAVENYRVLRNSIGQAGSNLRQNVRNMGEVSAQFSSFTRYLHRELPTEKDLL